MQEQTRTFLVQNTIFGLLIGGSFIVTSLICFQTGQNISLNPQLNNIIMILTIAGLFIGGRKYRESHLNGIVSYSKALGTCVYMITVAALLYGIYVYFLYRYTPSLLTDYFSMLEAAFKELYANSPLMENMLGMLKVLTTPFVIAFAEVFNKIFSGFIFSLLLAGLLKRVDLNPKP